MIQSSYQESHLGRARASIRQMLMQSLQRARQLRQRSDHFELQTAFQTRVEQVSNTLDKLDQGVIRIAAFGLVSRGKSAVLNALMGQKIFPTGPLHGVTQWPRSVRWVSQTNSQLQVELIDTPGLDEVEGCQRAQMAHAVAQEADLILFVIAGDMTRTEYQALWELRQAQKPLLVVFNKTDLYPDYDRQAIYGELNTLGFQSTDESHHASLITPEEIIMVAADPAPLQVRVEWPDGRVTHEWESPSPQIDPLRRRIADILSREGRSLLAINALLQAREAGMAIAHETVEAFHTEAEALIWRFARYKALVVAVNPIAFLDVVGGAMTDLVLIRSLARLYGLPMTSYQASQLWRTILLSSGGLLLGELVSSFFLGLGKSAAAIAGTVDSPSLTVYVGTAATQGAIAGYGVFTVGRAAQTYLEQGCTWGANGPSTVIREILSQVGANTILHRLRQELAQELGRESDGSGK